MGYYGSLAIIIIWLRLKGRAVAVVGVFPHHVSHQSIQLRTQEMADENRVGTSLSDKNHKSSSDDREESIGDKTRDYELKGLPLSLIIIGLGLAIFLMSLDSSIISTAIPVITSQFNSTGDIAWYGSAYSFSMCALQPIAGKLFASFSMKVRLPQVLPVKQPN